MSFTRFCNSWFIQTYYQWSSQNLISCQDSNPDCTWQEKKNLNPTTNHHATMVLAACWTAGTKLHSPPKADIWSLIMKNLWKSLEISMPLMPRNNEQIISDILLSCQTHLFWGCQGTQLLAGLPGGFNPWNFLWRFPTPWYKWKPLHVPNKVCKCLQKWNAK